MHPYLRNDGKNDTIMDLLNNKCDNSISNLSINNLRNIIHKNKS